MINIRKKTISIVLMFLLLVNVVGVINVDTVYAASKKIHLKKATVSVVAGKTYQQKLIDKNGKTIKATKVKWKSSKTSVAKINKKGKISAIKAGTAKMTAKYKGKTYKFTVKVKKAKSSNDYTSKDVSTLIIDTKSAFQYSQSMLGNYADWMYLAYTGSTFSHDDPKDYLNAYLSDLDATIEWLEKARKITSTKASMKTKTQEAKDAGYKTWDAMLASLIMNSIELKDENSIRNKFGYTLTQAKAFQEKIKDLNTNIGIAYDDFCAY